MTQRRAMLILHGKQALNEDVRDAVADKRNQGWELDVRVTWEGGDAQRLVSEALAAGHRHIVAGGGDGTLRDIAEALALASQALRLMDVEPSAVDLGEVGGKLFLNMATGGFGSQVTANTSEDLKKVLGGAAYLFTGLTRFSELHAAHGRGDLLALGIGNGRQAGGARHQHPAPPREEVVGTFRRLLEGGWGSTTCSSALVCPG